MHHRIRQHSLHASGMSCTILQLLQYAHSPNEIYMLPKISPHAPMFLSTTMQYRSLYSNHTTGPTEFLLEPTSTYFKVDINERQDTLSLDCFKLACLTSTDPCSGPKLLPVTLTLLHPSSLLSPSSPPLSPLPPPLSPSPPPQPQPVHTTRFGRHIHFPDGLMVAFIK